MAGCAVRPLRLCLCAVAVAVARSVDAEGPAQGKSSERVLLLDSPSLVLYNPLDDNGTTVLLRDRLMDVPYAAACTHFNGSVYCVGRDRTTAKSVKTWRFGGVDGSPLPPGPDLNRHVYWPGNGRMANVNNEWLVTCGDYGSEQPNTCQVLHVNASRWVEIESEACGHLSAVAEHNGSVFVAGGICNGSKADVWSLSVGPSASGNGTEWRRQPDMNRARAALAIASHKGYLYACGGRTLESPALSDCERWREGMHSWQGIAPLPQPRAWLHLHSVNGHLIAMGGQDGETYKLDVFDYNEAEDTWSRLHDMPDMPGFGSAVVPAQLRHATHRLYKRQLQQQRWQSSRE